MRRSMIDNAIWLEANWNLAIAHSCFDLGDGQLSEVQQGCQQRRFRLSISQGIANMVGIPSSSRSNHRNGNGPDDAL